MEKMESYKGKHSQWYLCVSFNT